MNNTTFVTALVPILFQIAAGTIDQADAITAILNLVNQWNSTASAASAMRAQNAIMQQVLTALNALFFKGNVDTAADLDPNAPDGVAYMTDDTGILYTRVLGKWVQSGTIVGPAGENASTNFGVSILGKFNNNELLQIITIPESITVNAAQVVGYVNTPGTAAVTLTLLRNGAAWGTVTFAAGQHTTVTATISNGSLSAGDVISVYAPAVVDLTFQDFSVTFRGN